MLRIERVGGLAGFGGVHSHVRSQGRLDAATLSIADKKAVDALFLAGGNTTGEPGGPDGFNYRISRTTSEGEEKVVVPEKHVPRALLECVKDELI